MFRPLPGLALEWQQVLQVAVFAAIIPPKQRNGATWEV